MTSSFIQDTKGSRNVTLAPMNMGEGSQNEILRPEDSELRMTKE